MPGEKISCVGCTNIFYRSSIGPTYRGNYCPRCHYQNKGEA